MTYLCEQPHALPPPEPSCCENREDLVRNQTGLASYNPLRVAGSRTRSTGRPRRTHMERTWCHPVTRDVALSKPLDGTVGEVVLIRGDRESQLRPARD